jgi:pilus assembly protein CpaE
MLQVFVIGRTATERSSLVRQLEKLVTDTADELEVLPHIAFRPTSLTELPYLEQADIVLVAASVAEEDLTLIRDIKARVEHTPVLVFLSSRLDRLSIVEQLARFGVADTLPEDVSNKDLLRKLVMYGSTKRKSSGSGKLVVVQGAKGGVGTTTIAAGLADAIFRDGGRVCILDFDLQRQGLSRFLQIKPFVNETLSTLLLGGRRIDAQMLEQLVTPLWEEDDNSVLHAIAAAPDIDEFHADSTRSARSLQSLLSSLQESYDAIIVDAGCVRGSLRRVLLSQTQVFVAVTSNDPGSLMAMMQMLARDAAHLNTQSQLICLENRIQQAGLPPKLVPAEIGDFLEREKRGCSHESLEFSKTGARWPGSGETFFSMATSRERSALTRIAAQVSEKVTASGRSAASIIPAIFSRSRSNTAALPATENRKENLQIEFKPTGETKEKASQGAEVRFSTPVFSK